MARQHPGRHGAAWNRVRAEVLARSTVCHLCGGPLDFNAPPRSKWSPSVDHLIPIARMRHLDMDTQIRLSLDPRNLRAAHYGHNASRGKRALKPKRVNSQEW